MSFDTARNNIPGGIGVALPKKSAGPDMATPNAIKYFGNMAGQAYLGIGEANLTKNLNTLGNEIAVLNDPNTQVVTDTRTPSLSYGQPVVDISKSDPTGTVNQSSQRFQQLAQARLQGKISNQMAEIQAEAVLRQSISRAPGFADEFRKQAQETLGFNPSGALMNLAYLSGPDLSKTQPKTQEEKWMEEAQAQYHAGLWPNVESAYKAIAQGAKSELDTKLEQAAVARGERNGPQVVTSVRLDTTKQVGALVATSLNALKANGAIQNAEQVNAGLTQLGEQLKNSWHVSMQASQDFRYPQDVYDNVDKAIDSVVGNYQKMLSDNSMTKILHDNVQQLQDLVIEHGLDVAPDLAIIKSVGGDNAVQVYLQYLGLAYSSPKSAEELAKANPEFRWVIDKADQMKAAGDSIRATLSGQPIPDNVSPDAAAHGLSFLGQKAIATGDPGVHNPTVNNMVDSNLPKMALSTVANTKGSYNIADDKTKQNVKQTWATNFEMIKAAAGGKLAGTNYQIEYDGRRFVLGLRDASKLSPQALQAYNSGIALVSVPGLVNTYGAPPNVSDQLEWLNEIGTPLMRQSGWGPFINGEGKTDPNQWISSTMHEINLQAIQNQLTTGADPAVIGLPQDQQKAIYEAFKTAHETGDMTGLQQELFKAGIDMPSLSAKPPTDTLSSGPSAVNYNPQVVAQGQIDRSGQQQADLAQESLLQSLRAAESFQAQQYNDPRGIPTIGYGHNIQASPLTKADLEAMGIDPKTPMANIKLTPAQADILLNRDVQGMKDKLQNSYIPNLNNIPPAAQNAAIELAFLAGPNSFKKAFAAINAGDTQKAVAEIKDSETWRNGLPGNKARLARIIDLVEASSQLPALDPSHLRF